MKRLLLIAALSLGSLAWAQTQDSIGNSGAAGNTGATGPDTDSQADGQRGNRPASMGSNTGARDRNNSTAPANHRSCGSGVSNGESKTTLQGTTGPDTDGTSSAPTQNGDSAGVFGSPSDSTNSSTPSTTH